MQVTGRVMGRATCAAGERQGRGRGRGLAALALGVLLAGAAACTSAGSSAAPPVGRLPGIGHGLGTGAA